MLSQNVSPALVVVAVGGSLLLAASAIAYMIVASDPGLSGEYLRHRFIQSSRETSIERVWRSYETAIMKVRIQTKHRTRQTDERRVTNRSHVLLTTPWHRGVASANDRAMHEATKQAAQVARYGHPVRTDEQLRHAAHFDKDVSIATFLKKRDQ